MNENTLTNKQINSYVENCTFVKTILMLIVVIYHCLLFWGGNWFTVIEPSVVIPSSVYFSGWLSTFHVYCFVLTSGYLYSFLRFEKHKYQHFGKFVKSKTFRLLIPFVFVSAIWAIPIGQVFYHLSLKEIITKYLLGVAPSQLWFLLMLFWVFVLVWICSNRIHRSIIFSVIFSITTYTFGLVGSHFINDYFQILTACQFVLFFVLGMKLRDAHSNGKLVNLKWYFLVVLFVFDVLIYIFKIRFFPKDGVLYTCVEMIIELVLNIIGSLLVFYLLQAIANKIGYIKLSNNNWYMMLAKSSMIIYLFHQQLIYISISLFNSLINPYLNMLINFVLAICVSVIISIIFTSNKYLSLLVGEKSK